MSYLLGQFDEKQRSGLSSFQLFNSAITPWVAFFTSIALGFAQGIKSIIGYNYGAKNTYGCIKPVDTG